MAKKSSETVVEQAEVRHMDLPVALKDSELSVRAQELASAEAELTDAETRLTRAVEAAKGTKKALEEEIAEHRLEVRRLAEVVRTKREDRQVPVVEELDFEAGAVHTVRTDLGVVVATRGMTIEERQRALFRDVKAGGKES